MDVATVSAARAGGAGLCVGLAARRRRQLGAAPVGPRHVSGGGRAVAAIARDALRRSRLRLLRPRPRRVRPIAAAFRFRGVPPDARRGRRVQPAGGDCPPRHRRSAVAGHPADRRRQVAVLSAAGPGAQRAPRRADRRAVAAAGVDEGPGGQLCGQDRQFGRGGGQRTAHPAGTRRRAGAGAAGHRLAVVRLAGTAAEQIDGRRHQAAGDRLLGVRRGPLPVEVGPRLPPGLPVRGPLHPRAGPGTGRSRRRRSPALRPRPSGT